MTDPYRNPDEDFLRNMAEMNRRYRPGATPDNAPQRSGRITLPEVLNFLWQLFVACSTIILAIIGFLFFPVVLVLPVLFIAMIVKANRRSNAAAVQAAVRQELDRRDAAQRDNNTANKTDRYLR